jgi:hypothetical protein
VLFLVAFGALLAGCAEVLPSMAPRPQLVSSGLGATRKEWEYDHKLVGPFERDVRSKRLRGLLYEGGIGVTYWVSGPQEAAPQSARISRIELDVPGHDHGMLRDLVASMLPEDATITQYNGPYDDPEIYDELLSSPSLGSVYKPLHTFSDNLGAWYWEQVRVKYSTGKPRVVILIERWGGIPPESSPLAVPTLPAPWTPLVPSQ